MRLAGSGDLDDSDERNHNNNNGKHEPADTVCPVRVDVLTERDRRVIHHRKHDQKLHNTAWPTTTHY